MDDILISRRKVLLGAGCVAATTMFSGIRVAFADAPVEERFIFIILRGAMDGLNAIPPYGDRAYATARNGIALPSSAYTPLDNFFGAHKSLANFTSLFASGEATAIQAVSTLTASVPTLMRRTCWNRARRSRMASTTAG